MVHCPSLQHQICHSASMLIKGISPSSLPTSRKGNRNCRIEVPLDRARDRGSNIARACCLLTRDPLGSKLFVNCVIPIDAFVMSALLSRYLYFFTSPCSRNKWESPRIAAELKSTNTITSEITDSASKPRSSSPSMPL